MIRLFCRVIVWLRFGGGVETIKKCVFFGNIRRFRDYLDLSTFQAVNRLYLEKSVTLQSINLLTLWSDSVDYVLNIFMVPKWLKIGEHDFRQNTCCRATAQLDCCSCPSRALNYSGLHRLLPLFCILATAPDLLTFATKLEIQLFIALDAVM